MQAVGAGVISSLAEARTIIRASVDTEEFTPQNSDEWNTAYKRFQNIK